MSNKKELKQTVLQQFKEDKLAKKARKKEISLMSAEDKKVAIEEDKQLRKEKKKERKAYLKTLNKEEKKVEKKKNKIYKKLKSRPRRWTIWGILIALILFIVVKFGPLVTDMAVTLSSKHITVKVGTKKAKEAIKEADKISQEIADEGMVLLKNEDKSLPLADKKVNVFGSTAFSFKSSGGGSGGTDLSRAVTLFEGLENAGIDYNKELHDYYAELPEMEGMTGTASTGLTSVIGAMLGGGEEFVEPTVSDEALKQAVEYSDNALVIIQSSGVEASDMDKEQLELTDEMANLIDTVASTFSNVTIIVNTGNTFELGFVNDYPSIKSVLWVGTPGPFGTNSIGKILSGDLNPSGRLADTYAYDVESAPATENFGDYKYDNLDKAYLNYEEGIYVGYRFYETYYHNDEKGYDKAVQFPFGSGLSYTNFDWKVLEQKFSDETMEVKVEVTNTGKVAGKDVVQLYYSAPYTTGGIEKSAINLITFAKTKELKAGEKETITLSFDTRDMASYDMKNEYYVLEKGKYEIKLGKNVHEIKETLNYDLKKEIIYKADADTGTEYQNLFTESENEIDVLSRNDWEGTYPSDEDNKSEASSKVIDRINNIDYNDDQKMPTLGADNNLKLEDLKGLAYDDPKWEKFLDQLTVDQMIDYVSDGGWHTNAIDELGVPATVLLDGPAGINYFFKSFEAGAYPSEIVVASTWNQELAYTMGETIAKEAKALGVHGWYAPTLNIHRNAFGGRNFEYMSEDPVLNGLIGTGIVKASEDLGVTVYMKHFAMNEQETNARTPGLAVWADEQTIREIHMKSFEMVTKESGVTGAMSSFSIIDGKWANSALLNGLLREEWGFDGVVSSDAQFGHMNPANAVISGNDLMLGSYSVSGNKKTLKKAYDEHPEAIANGLRTSMHNSLYATLETYLFD
ncbi:MAG: glycoside hydrolase family 3 C-terminal domain-containing protein [Lactovum sp.]